MTEAGRHEVSLFDGNNLTPGGEAAITPGGEAETGDIKALIERLKNPKMDKPFVEMVILRVCEGEFRTVKELATTLGRRASKLREDYLTPMVADGRLTRRYPEAPAHPKQAYRTTNT